ncbi:CBS domain-containing protein [Aliiroseovarius sp. F20344]|uniref:CBS domain-containing protein n=1 Tax=Aliiroseovarius sp. F20344 TaxID=2926414 RepID=UPI001FF53FFD|nr:CBS domain-containing protein [Aliiroseovarius sp. F20344]MCK0141493.1 CBS domain-containing protein [Aliiroseovarius sp. F20344]
MDENNLKVRDVMQSTIYMISGLATVRDAVNEMDAKGVTALVIERRHDEDEYGIVSIEMIAERAIALNKSLDRTNVYEVMDKPALTLSDHMAVKYAVRLLSRLDHRRALVVNEGTACGLATLRDMVLSYAVENDS